MKLNSNRRAFIQKSAFVGCTLLISGKISLFPFPQDEIRDVWEHKVIGKAKN